MTWSQPSDETVFPRPAERINRQITGKNNGNRIEDRPVHIFCCRENNFVQLVRPSLPQRQFAVNVFNHHDGAINDDAKINGADGEQICGYIVRVEHDEGKQKRERNGQSHNESGAEADQKEDQHNQNQEHAAKQICFHGVGGQVHQLAAVIIRMNLDVGGQYLAVQFLSLCFHSLEHVLRLFPTQHEDDAFDGIVVLLKAEFTEPGRMPNGYISDILHTNGYAFVRAHHNVSNVVGVTYQPDSTNVVELSSLRIKTAAGIRIICSESGRNLRNCQVIPIQACGVQQHLVLHHGSTKARVIRHAVDRSIRSLHHPIFNRFQFLRSAVRTFQHVAIHQAARAE